MTRMISIVNALIALCILTSCSSSPYTYHVIAFGKSSGTTLAKGVGKAEQCKALFEPPGVYIGPYIVIPKDASVFGALVVVRKGEVKVIPLYTWHDNAGVERFGCNGPAPQFAHHGKSQDELAKSIAGTLGEKE